MINRIKSLLDYLQINENAFSNIIGISQRTLNYYINGKRKPSFELIEKILNAYPDLSAEWLLRGEGDMYRTSNMDYEKSESYNEELLKNFVDQTSTLLSNRDERIRELEIENAALKSGISVKNVG